MKYDVDCPTWMATDRDGQEVIITSGWRVVRIEPSPGTYCGVPLNPDPTAVAYFDDEATARAVCRDMNRAVGAEQ